MINTAVEDPERVARGLVRLAQSHRQLCADFLRDHRDGMDTPAVAKFATGTPCSARRLTAWPRTLPPDPFRE
jgi:hypothetical protein